MPRFWILPPKCLFYKVETLCVFVVVVLLFSLIFSRVCTHSCFIFTLTYLVPGHRCHTTCARARSEASPQDAVPSFNQVDSGSCTRAIRFGNTRPNPLNHPVGPPSGFHKGWSSAQHVMWYAWTSPALAAAQALQKQRGLCGICEGCLLFKSPYVSQGQLQVSLCHFGQTGC